MAEPLERWSPEDFLHDDGVADVGRIAEHLHNRVLNPAGWLRARSRGPRMQIGIQQTGIAKGIQITRIQRVVQRTEIVIEDVVHMLVHVVLMTFQVAHRRRRGIKV